MTRAVLILLNGELRGPKAIRAVARGAGAVICADGGARLAARLGLEPDFVVGDMDSAPPRPRRWRRTRYLRDADPERSDLDKALGLARGLGARDAFVAGVLGGGLDHELINLAAIEEGARGLALTVLDGGRARLLGPGRHALPYKAGTRFSLLAAPRARLSLTGARFGLRRETLVRGSRGLGNAARGRVVLTVHAGRVWAISPY